MITDAARIASVADALQNMARSDETKIRMVVCSNTAAARFSVGPWGKDGVYRELIRAEKMSLCVRLEAPSESELTRIAAKIESHAEPIRNLTPHVNLERGTNAPTVWNPATSLFAQLVVVAAKYAATGHRWPKQESPRPDSLKQWEEFNNRLSTIPRDWPSPIEPSEVLDTVQTVKDAISSNLTNVHAARLLRYETSPGAEYAWAGRNRKGVISALRDHIKKCDAEEDQRIESLESLRAGSYLAGMDLGQLTIKRPCLVAVMALAVRGLPTEESVLERESPNVDDELPDTAGATFGPKSDSADEAIDSNSGKAMAPSAEPLQSPTTIGGRSGAAHGSESDSAVAIKWNRDDRVLKVSGETVREFAPQTGDQVFTILDAFEEDGWPDAIDLPVEKLNASSAIRTINKCKVAISFHMNGDRIQVKRSLREVPEKSL